MKINELIKASFSELQEHDFEEDARGSKLKLEFSTMRGIEGAKD